jgi:hypothetical protein
VQEAAVQPPPHHPVGRDRRVDAAGQQDKPAPAHPDRQATLAREAVRVQEDLRLIDLDMEREVGVPQVDRVAVGALDPASDRDRQLG